MPRGSPWRTVAKAVELVSPPVGQALLQLSVMFAAVYAVLAFRRVYGKVRFSFARIAFVLAAYVVAFARGDGDYRDTGRVPPVVADKSHK